MIEGLVLCAALTGADYGWSTQRAMDRGAVEVGPIAKHSMLAGAAVKTGTCAAGEVLFKDKKKTKWVWRGLMVAGTGAVVYHNEKQRGPKRGVTLGFRIVVKR